MEVPSLVQEEDGMLVLRHLYIERRMTPLDLYLTEGQPRGAARHPG